MKRLTITVLCFALASCASQQSMMWKHESHVDKSRFDRERAQCEYEAAQATASYTPNNRGYRTMFGQSLADAMAIGQRQGEIGMLCMKARGYSLHPVDHTVIR